MNYSDFAPITQNIQDHPTTVTLPSVGVRAHRIFLTDRPFAYQSWATYATVTPGPAVPDDRDSEGSPVGWGLLSLGMALLLVCSAFILTGVHL